MSRSRFKKMVKVYLATLYLANKLQLAINAG